MQAFHRIGDHRPALPDMRGESNAAALPTPSPLTDLATGSAIYAYSSGRFPALPHEQNDYEQPGNSSHDEAHGGIDRCLELARTRDLTLTDLPPQGGTYQNNDDVGNGSHPTSAPSLSFRVALWVMVRTIFVNARACPSAPPKGSVTSTIHKEADEGRPDTSCKDQGCCDHNDASVAIQYIYSQETKRGEDRERPTTEADRGWYASSY